MAFSFEKRQEKEKGKAGEKANPSVVFKQDGTHENTKSTCFNLAVFFVFRLSFFEGFPSQKR